MTNMTVFVTPDHDLQFCDADRIAELTDAELDELAEAAKRGEYQLHTDCYGDEYANEVINSIGFFNAHYGEV